ncbi:uncharacterized protein [Anoplolepis gracilipes]|uniref:uncharacterized protein n=1 Tax=Anoplolepis gracilipes TaxID=354296 RepID=UPI003BA26E33
MENVQQKERDLLERSHQVTTLGEYFGWLQHCEEFIEELEERSRVKCPRLSIENRQSLVTRIARLEGAKTRLQRQFIPSGGDYSSENNKMENVQQKERDLLERSHQVTTLGEYFGWVQHCEEFIEELEERSRVKCPRLSIENRQSLVTRIARLEGAKTRLQRQFIPSGGDYSSENNKMENVQQKERDLLERSHQVTTLGEYFGWVQHCEEFIEELEERSRVKCPRLSIENRQSLVTRIARLEGAKTRLQRQFIPSGGDYSSENNKMENVQQKERDLLERSHQVTTLGEYFGWVQHCEEFIEELEERSRVKRPRLSIGNRQSLVTRIARLEGAKTRLQRQFIPSGGDYSSENNSERLIWREIDTAFESRILTGAVINYNHIEPRQFLEDASDIVLEHVRDVMQKHNSVKVNTVFNGEFVAGDKHANKSINTRNCELLHTSDLREWYERRVVEPILASLEEFQERDSGWALSRIINLIVNINKYNPMRAGCYVQLSRKIIVKRAVVNVQSKDNACFAWAVVAALYPAERYTHRQSSYPHYTTVLNFQDIEFPVTLNQIKKFEIYNDISINVYSFENENIVPIHLTEQKRDKHVNLLYVQDAQNIGHFAWIKNLSRLVSMQLSKHKTKKYICDRCMHYFHSVEKLQSHTVDCGKMNDCAIRLPSDKDKWLAFTNYNRKERLPFVVYADLECVLVKKEEENFYQHHQVFSMAYYVHCSYDNSLSAYHSRREANCVAWFTDELKNLAQRVENILTTNVPMVNLTQNEWKEFRSATQCHICEKPFVEDDTRVRDHCHLTGRYRGPAHSNCNLNYKESFCIPIVFHNLSGYDSHFIIEEIATAFEGEIDLLPITKEKYISFTKHVKGTKNKPGNHIKLRFIDSYKFLTTSLDKLASFLSKDKLKILQSEYKNLSAEDFNLLTRKGVFPYEYIDCVDKLQDVCLPSRESFYSSLTGNTVSESDYAHAEIVWKRFSIRTLGEYSDLYLKIDVLLLADIFENFRESCIKSYGLDPAYYYTLPGYTWDAMLKYTKIIFELLTNIDMVMFIERGIRGGLSQCSNRIV